MGIHNVEREARRRFVALAASMGVLAGLACGGASPEEPEPIEALEWQVYEHGSFRVDLPAWPSRTPDDDATLVAVGTESWDISVARHAIVPRLIGRHFARVLPDHGEFASITLDDRDPGRVVLEARVADEAASILRIIFLYCDGASYQISGRSPQDSSIPFLGIFDGVLRSAGCRAEWRPDPQQNGQIGLVLNPARADFEFENYRAGIVQAREAGVQAAHQYVQWGQIESEPEIYDWTVSDLLIDTLALEGMRLSLVIEFIHTSLPGSAPRDLEGLAFDDPVYLDRAALFAAAVAERYGDVIDYLALGNEVNIYFQENPAALDPYLSAFGFMKEEIHAVRPGLPVGTVIAFHSAVNAGRLDLVGAFHSADFLAFTYYPHAAGFRYDVPVNGFGGVLDHMLEVAGGKPFIVVENGFSSAPSLGSSESRQADYIRETFSALALRRTTFERHIWFGYHDGQGEVCAEAALSFFPADFDPSTIDPQIWTAFQDYLCSLGLRRFDGSPKMGWEVFQQELEAYRQGQ